MSGNSTESINEEEARDGFRLTWNALPLTKQEQQRLLLPLGCLYTPLKQVKNKETGEIGAAKLVAYPPVRCRGIRNNVQGSGGGNSNDINTSICGAILNPFAHIDLQSKTWTCSICGYRNALSQFYAENISPTQLPPESSATTIEYLLNNDPDPSQAQDQGGDAPVFLFVLDTALNNPEDEDEFQQAKESLQQILQLMPPNSLVGLISYGMLVQVHELGFSEMNKSYSFRGTKACSAIDVNTQLQLPSLKSPPGPGGQANGPSTTMYQGQVPAGNNPHQQYQQQGHRPPLTASQEVRRRFLLPISECEFMLNSVIDELTKDKWYGRSNTNVNIPRQPEARSSSVSQAGTNAQQQQPNMDNQQSSGQKSPPSPFDTTKRCGRCTGAALSVAVGLIENLCSGKPESQITGGRIILLSSGPTTMGPGQIVSLDKSEVMRSHQDLEKGRPNAKHSKPAITFYAQLAARLVQSGFGCDIFANSLDQIGSYEMRVLTDRTGGVLVMADGFSTNVFKDSFTRLFSKTDDSGFLLMGFNAKINLLVSHKELKISGAIGGCCSAQNGKEPNGGPKKNPHQHMIADSDVGESNTTQWRIAILDNVSTLGFFLEVCNTDDPNYKNKGQQQQQGGYMQPVGITQTRYAYMQFQTLYHHPSGARRLRVTTIARPMTTDSSTLASGFDQECMAAIVSRQAMLQVESGVEIQDTINRLDRCLIRVISRFASYNKGDVNSFFLPESFTFFPQFLYYLRRSPYLSLFNASPDETAYYRSCLNRETCINMLVMIQPALMEFSLNSVTQAGEDDYNEDGTLRTHKVEPLPVLLDSTSMKKDVILLMDSFFYVVIWKGATIQQWVDQGFHLQENYEHLKVLIEQPALDARDILQERFPTPKFISTTEGGSQARFLLARVNPSKTPTREDVQGQPGNQSSVVLTEDASLKVFMQTLIGYAVAE